MTTRPAFRHQLVGLAVAACFAGAAHGNPTGPAVATGSASFATSGNTLTVTNTPGTIINWQAFSIRPDEITRFIQSGAASAVLNRVTGGQQSALLGQLLSNGRVFLINPNGVAIGAGARIDTAGFVASSLSLSNEDFLAGRFRFTDPGNAGKVTNAGTINAHAGGPVYLVAPSVENHGVINAPNGEILLAAGKSVELVAAASPHLRVQVHAGGETLNVGQLVAESGRVGLYGAAIRNSGTISADSASVNAAGNVVLKAARDVTLDSTSVVTANGPQGGTVHVQAEQGTLLVEGRVEAKGDADRGGEVKLLGTRVGLVGNAAVDASGATGGGSVLVGGDYQGGNAEIQNAARTHVGSETTIRADAGSVGDGGKVVVWADGDTRFGGDIKVRGGASAGNGGVVEVSGRETLDFQGTADTSAARGATGTLLLDPSNITISTGANANMTGATPFTAVAATGTLNTGTLQAALATSNVVVDTTSPFASAGDITVSNTVTWASANSLTLRAHNNINVNAAVGATGTGSLNLVADQDANGAGNVALAAAVSTRSGGVSASGASITSTAAGTITTGAAGVAGGNVTLQAAPTGSVSLTGAVNANGGAGTAGAAGNAAGNIAIIGGSIAVRGLSASGGAGTGPGARAGGNGGMITLDATGAGSTISLANGATSSILAQGGAGVNGGTGGAGGGVTVSDPAVVVNNLTVNVSGGAGGTAGAGGMVTMGAANSAAAAARTLTLTAGSGNIIAGALGATDSFGAITATGRDLTFASINTTGRNNAAGQNVALTGTAVGGAGGIVNVAGPITTSGGTRTGAGVGFNAGTVAVTGASTTVGEITARGSNASGGAASAGGNGGGVTLTANAVGGALQVDGAINTHGGDSVNAGNTGNGGAVILRAADAGTVATAAAATIVTTGGRGQTGGGVTVSGVAAANTLASVTLQGAITTNGGTAATAGKNAGAVNITQAETIVVGAPITTRGSDAATADNVGGTGGQVFVDARDLAGTAAALPSIQVAAAIDTRGGNSVGTGNTGNGGNVRLRTSDRGAIATTAAGTVTTTGGRGQTGGTFTVAGIAAADTITAVNLAGAIDTSGGVGTLAGAAGKNAGAISITQAEAVSLGPISARGSSSTSGTVAGAAGGSGGGVTVTVRDIVATAATPSIALAGAIDTRGSDSTGTTNGGNGGAVALRSSAGGAVTSAAAATINTSGGRGQTGGAVSASSTPAADTLASINLSGALTTSGGQGATNAVGLTAGGVTLNNTTAITVGAITARGGNAGGGNAIGGNGGTVNVTARNGTPSVQLNGAIDTRGGDSAGTGNTGNGGGVTVATSTANGTIAGSSAATIDTTGGRGQTGGVVSVQTTGAGAIDLQGVVTANGGTAATGLGGKNAGSVTVGSATTTTTQVAAISATGGNAATGVGGTGAAVLVRGTGGVTLRGNLTTTGGTGAGAAGGAGAGVTATGPTTLGANVAINSAGGTGTATGAGGAVNFGATSPLNSDATARSLTVTSGTGAVTLGAAVGAANALASTSVTGGAVSLRGVRSTGAQSYSGTGVTLNGTLQSTTAGSIGVTGPVTLAGASAAQTAGNAGDNVSFSSTINGAQALAVNAGNAGAASFGGTIGQTTALTSLAVTAAAATLPATRTGTLAVTTGGGNIAQTGAIVATGATTLNAGTGNVVLTTATNNFGGAVSTTAANANLRDTNALALGTSTLSGNLAVTANGAVTQTGALAVGGTTTIAAGPGPVTLAGANDFGGDVAVTTTGTATVNDVNALALGASSVGTLTATAAGALAVNGTLTASGAGNAIVLAGSSFANNAGAGALAPGTGRWLVYSADPAANTFGGLASGNQAVWNTAYPAAVAAAGNRYVFSTQPTVTLTSTNAPNKIYGDLADVSTNYSASGFVNATPYGNVFTQDTVANALSGLSVTSAGTPVTANAGVYTIVVAATATTGYALTINNAGQLTVDPRPITITPGPLARPYGDPNPTTTTTLTVGGAGLVNGNTVTQVDVSSPATATDPAGSALALNASNAAFGGGGLGSNYAITYAPGVLTIGQRAISVQANDQTRAYGDANPSTGPYALTSGSLAGTDMIGSVNVTSPALPTSPAGSVFVLTNTGANFTSGSAANYSITLQNGQLTIAQRPITVRANDQGRPYGDPNPTTGPYTITSGSLAGTDMIGSVNVTSPALATSPAGGLWVLTNTGANFTAGSAANYAVTLQDGQLTITPRPITVQANNQARPYGDPNPTTGPYTLAAGTLAGADSITNVNVSSPATVASGVGPYALTPTAADFGVGSATNYTITFVDGVLTITPRPINITANNQAKVYGQPDPALTFTAATVNGDVLNGALVRAPGETVAAGPYAITQGTVTDANNPNYLITFANGQLVIAPAALTIAANNAARQYGDANPAFTATYTGLANGDGPGAIPGVALTTPAVPASNAGPYAINVASGVNSNYVITTVNGQLVITPAPLTIAANDAARGFGQPNPPFTATATGFKLGQTVGDLSGTLAITTPATLTSPAGPYPITPSGVSSTNYAITFVNGTLLVGQAPPAPPPIAQLPPPSDPALITAVERSANDTPDSIQPVSVRAVDCLVLERSGVRQVLNRCY